MKYQNKKTGVIINVNSAIEGGNWAPVTQQTGGVRQPKEKEQKQVASEKAPAQSNEAAPSGDAEFDGITVKEIKQELDANGIKYSKAAKKSELYALMMGK